METKLSGRLPDGRQGSPDSTRNKGNDKKRKGLVGVGGKLLTNVTPSSSFLTSQFLIELCKNFLKFQAKSTKRFAEAAEEIKTGYNL
jgi:hypothetical protein